MAISLECTGCSKKLKVKDEAAGKRIKCPECQAVLTVPKPESAGDEDDFLGGLNEAVKQEKRRPRLEPDEDDEDSEDYDDAPSSSAPRRRSKPAASKTKKRTSSGSGGGGGVLKAIGGGLVALLVILGIVGKVAQVARNGGFLNSSAKWTQFTHPTGGASIEMPGTPKLDIKQSGAANGQVYSVDNGRYACSFASVPFPPGTPDISSNAVATRIVFDEVKRTFTASKPGSRFISESPQRVGTVTGQEFTFEVGIAMNQSRVFLTPTHVIVAEFVYQKGRDPTTERTRFFNSLQITAQAGGAVPAPGMAMPGASMPGMAMPGTPPGPGLRP